MTPSKPIALVGDRVVVRYLLGDATPADWRGDPAAAQSDVTGVLLDDADPLRLERDGEVVSIPRSEVTSLRVLSAKPVRNSEIRELELLAAKAWPGVESTWLDGWLVRAGHGFTRRANSAVPVDRSARADAESLHRIAHWYADRALSPLLSIPDRLLSAATIGGTEGVEVQMLTGVLAAITPLLPPPSRSIRLQPEPDEAWLESCRRDREADPAHVRAVLTAGEGRQVFADADGASSIGRGAIVQSATGTSWLGISTLWTDPARRRRGLSAQVLAAVMDWGAEHGAERAFLQVETDHRIAGTWYRRIGFGIHHTYRYLTPALGGPPGEAEA